MKGLHVWGTEMRGLEWRVLFVCVFGCRRVRGGGGVAPRIFGFGGGAFCGVIAVGVAHGNAGDVGV